MSSDRSKLKNDGVAFEDKSRLLPCALFFCTCLHLQFHQFVLNLSSYQTLIPAFFGPKGVADLPHYSIFGTNKIIPQSHSSFNDLAPMATSPFERN